VPPPGSPVDAAPVAADGGRRLEEIGGAEAVPGLQAGQTVPPEVLGSAAERVRELTVGGVADRGVPEDRTWR
jgi:hypothetical protein